MTKKKISITDIPKLKEKIKTLLTRFGASMIPLTAVFEILGYSGMTGLGWGILSAIIVCIADDLGLQLVDVGGRYFLHKKQQTHKTNEEVKT